MYHGGKVLWDRWRATLVPSSSELGELLMPDSRLQRQDVKLVYEAGGVGSVETHLDRVMQTGR
jgi:hypothetical protein